LNDYVEFGHSLLNVIMLTALTRNYGIDCCEWYYCVWHRYTLLLLRKRNIRIVHISN